MLDIDDSKWKELEGGYRRPYDPRNALLALKADGDDDEAWNELWNNLHHQGDVGLASYAAVPCLTEIFKDKRRNWRVYSLITVIEVERHGTQNPPIPDWLEASYKTALGKLVTFAAEDLTREGDKTFLQALLGAIAAAKGDMVRAELLGNFTADELEEMLEMYLRA